MFTSGYLRCGNPKVVARSHYFDGALLQFTQSARVVLA